MSRLLRAQLPLIGSLGEAWQTLRSLMAGHYRPERHYMRGPGPKARAKRED
jgi:hypothetical protein